MTAIAIFLGLGGIWALFGAYQIFSLAADPDRWRYVGQAMAMSALNLAVALFINWMRDRRRRTDR